MTSAEIETFDDQDDLEDWLESELVSDEGAIKVPPGVTFPSKLRWIASDGANVVVNQVLAAFSVLPPGDGRAVVSPTASAYPSENACLDVDMEDVAVVPSEEVDGPTATDNNDDGLDSVSKANRCASYGDSSEGIIAALTCGAQGRSNVPSAEALQGPFLLKSTMHGTLKHLVPTDTVITDPSTVLGTVDSASCPHSVVIHGLCVNCCQVVDYPSPKRRVDGPVVQATRQAADGRNTDAPAMVVPGFITNNNAVRVDASVSNELELLELLRLLSKRKLCLVLDLDNTLIHSSCSKAPDDMDIPVIDMYHRSDGRKLQFDDEGEMLRYEQGLESSMLITKTMNEHDGRYFVNYYKLRPGVYEFLRRSAELYELYLFTMGTRAHAQAALKILDPSGTFFGNRVFSRSESNNCYKSLCRIFPNYRHHLLILDDSEHVWVNAPGLIKVYPYYYFTDLSLFKNRDSRHMGRLSAALQAACNYSNYVWQSVMMEVWKQNEEVDRISRDDEGFTIPAAVQLPGKRPRRFKYNSMLMANERPSSLFPPTEGSTQRKDGGISQYGPGTTTDQKRDSSHVDDSVLPEAMHSKDSKCTQSNDACGTQGDPGSKETTSTGMLQSSSALDGGDAPATSAPASSSPASSGTMMRRLRKIRVADYDAQLPCVTTLLREMHRRFFSEIDTSDLTVDQLKELIATKRLPDVGELLSRHREHILKGVVLAVSHSDFRCPRTGEDVDFFSRSDLGLTARRFGVLPPSDRVATTHYLKNNACSVAPKAGLKTVHSQWLEACIYTWRHVEESRFDSETWREPFRTFWDVLYSPHS